MPLPVLAGGFLKKYSVPQIIYRFKCDKGAMQMLFVCFELVACFFEKGRKIKPLKKIKVTLVSMSVYVKMRDVLPNS